MTLFSGAVNGLSHRLPVAKLLRGMWGFGPAPELPRQCDRLFAAPSSLTEVLRVQPQRVPADAPNILIVLIDDAGAGLRLTYGDDVRMDTLI
jgi:hypothetical protein